MSAEGLLAAQWLARVQPLRAAQLAAELRNAVTPAHVVAQELSQDGMRYEEMSDDVWESVRHVLAIADALQPGGRLARAEMPTVPNIAHPDRDSSGGHEIDDVTSLPEGVVRRVGQLVMERDKAIARIAELEAERDALKDDAERLQRTLTAIQGWRLETSCDPDASEDAREAERQIGNLISRAALGGSDDRS